MGEGCKRALRVVFDRSVKLEFHGARVTSDAGLLPYRELDEVFEFTTIDMKTNETSTTSWGIFRRGRIAGGCVGRRSVTFVTFAVIRRRVTLSTAGSPGSTRPEGTDRCMSPN